MKTNFFTCVLAHLFLLLCPGVGLSRLPEAKVSGWKSFIWKLINLLLLNHYCDIESGGLKIKFLYGERFFLSSKRSILCRELFVQRKPIKSKWIFIQVEKDIKLKFIQTQIDRIKQGYKTTCLDNGKHSHRGKLLLNILLHSKERVLSFLKSF